METGTPLAIWVQKHFRALKVSVGVASACLDLVAPDSNDDFDHFNFLVAKTYQQINS